MPPRQNIPKAAEKKRFQLDAVQAEVDLTPYEFDFAGKTWVLTHQQALDGIAQAEVSKLGIEAAGMEVLKMAFEDQRAGQWTEFRKHTLPLHQLMALINAYGEHCGASAGE